MKDIVELLGIIVFILSSIVLLTVSILISKDLELVLHDKELNL